MRRPLAQTMSTKANPAQSEAGHGANLRRLAVVLARHHAGLGAPPGIDPSAFAAACLADSYEVVAGLTDVQSGIAGTPDVREMLWPGDRLWPAQISVSDLAADISGDVDELVVIPADVPDLPALVLAKVFRALQRADVAIAPERGGNGCVAIGVSVPMASWIPSDLNLDSNLIERLQAAAPRRNRCAVAPDWHRLRTPTAVERLDPGLEGWEETRALLSGLPLGPRD
jgi:Guanylyl transferase CofC like